MSSEHLYTITELVHRKKLVNIVTLMNLYGIQIIAEAEKMNYIETSDNENYKLTLTGQFLLLTSVDSRELSTSFDTKNNTLVVHLRGNSSIQMNIELQKYSNRLWIKFISGDESFNLNNLDPETLTQLIDTLIMFRDYVLNTKEEVAEEKG